MSSSALQVLCLGCRQYLAKTVCACTCVRVCVGGGSPCSMGVTYCSQVPGSGPPLSSRQCTRRKGSLHVACCLAFWASDVAQEDVRTASALTLLPLASGLGVTTGKCSVWGAQDMLSVCIKFSGSMANGNASRYLSKHFINSYHNFFIKTSPPACPQGQVYFLILSSNLGAVTRPFCSK